MTSEPQNALRAKARWLNPWVFGMLVFSVLFFPTLILQHRQQVSVLRDKINTIQAEMATVNLSTSNLESLIARRDELAARNAFLEQQRSQVLRHCRNADDIPWLSQDFIVAESRSTKLHSFASCIFVPTGDHRLTIGLLEFAGQEEPWRHGFEFQLLPESGCMLELVYNENAMNDRPFRLVLTCGRDGFDERPVIVPISDIEVKSSSWQCPHVTAFPAEVPSANSSAKERGVEILRITWTGAGNQPKVEAVVRVVSNATPCANPQYARRIKLTRRSQEVWYRGNGRYDLPGYGSQN